MPRTVLIAGQSLGLHSGLLGPAGPETLETIPCGRRGNKPPKAFRCELPWELPRSLSRRTPARCLAWKELWWAHTVETTLQSQHRRWGTFLTSFEPFFFRKSRSQNTQRGALMWRTEGKSTSQPRCHSEQPSAAVAFPFSMQASGMKEHLLRTGRWEKMGRLPALEKITVQGRDRGRGRGQAQLKNHKRTGTPSPTDPGRPSGSRAFRKVS